METEDYFLDCSVLPELDFQNLEVVNACSVTDERAEVAP